MSVLEVGGTKCCLAANQRIFTILNAIQDSALMQSSSQIPIQEADLQFLHTEDMSNGPSLGDNDDYGSILRRSSPCISTKSLPWARVGIHLMGLHHVVQTPFGLQGHMVTPEEDVDGPRGS